METLKDWYKGGDNTKSVPKLVVGVFGAVAGAASVFGNTPIDVIKTRMQVYSAHVHIALKIFFMKHAVRVHICVLSNYDINNYYILFFFYEYYICVNNRCFILNHIHIGIFIRNLVMISLNFSSF